MISDAELLSWTKAEAEDTALLRSLERAAIATVENRTGYYFGLEAAITESRFWRGGPLELRAVPVDGEVTVEYWSGSAWAAADTSTFYVSGRFLRAASSAASAFTIGTELRIAYTGGYTVDEGDEDVWDAPEEIKDAVRTVVAVRYLFREGVDGSGKKIDFDQVIDSLVRDSRRMTA